MADDGRWKHPPQGVPAHADPDRPYLALSKAAQRAGVDRRTLQAAVIRGETAGWARPGPGYLRWFVYEDALPASRGRYEDNEIGRLRAEVAALRAEVAEMRISGSRGVPDEAAARSETLVADLRARLVSVEATNLLLIQAHENLEAASRSYRQALAQFMTPGHPGDLPATPAG